jgi:hypothetical protein
MERAVNRSLSLLAALAIVACEAGPDEPLEDPTPTMIGDRDIPPPPAVGFQIVTPVLEIPPGEERFFCYYGTYDGPDVGVYKLVIHDDPNFAHHSLLKEPLAVEDADKEDGDLIDCSSLEEQFPPRPTLLESVHLGGGRPEPGDEEDRERPDWMEGYEWVNLPPEFGFRFDSGQRWLADVHFVNWSDETVRTRAVFDLHTVPEADVENFVNTWNHDAGGFSLPPGQPTTLDFACSWDHDVNILAIGGHMHAHGSSYRVDHVSPQGPVRTGAYEVEEWTPDLRFVPRVDQYEPGDWVVRAGDSFRTECSWFNNEDRALSFPDEMCTTFGVGYPIDEAIYCVGHQQGAPPQ